MTIANFIRKSLGMKMICPASKTAYKYLKGKKGIEIGASSYCDFCLNTLNVDVNDNLDPNLTFNKEQKRFHGEIKKVDVIASGDNLPFKNNQWDFVISSHVLEHFFDPIKTLNEWLRVIKPGGYIFMIIPHKERTRDNDKQRTTLQELIDRHSGVIKSPENIVEDVHYSIWKTEDVLELCSYLNLDVAEYHDVDDTRGDGFIVIVRKKQKNWFNFGGKN